MSTPQIPAEVRLTAAAAVEQELTRYLHTPHSLVETVLESVAPALRAQFAEEAAIAIEAEKHGIGGMVNYGISIAAAIVRDLGVAK